MRSRAAATVFLFTIVVSFALLWLSGCKDRRPGRHALPGSICEPLPRMNRSVLCIVDHRVFVCVASSTDSDAVTTCAPLLNTPLAERPLADAKEPL